MSQLKGWLGEKFTQLGMWIGLNGKTYQRFHNVVVPTSNGTTQIDHVLVSPFGIFIIETKNMNGWIYGDEKDKQWTQVFHRKKFRFQNPIHQNYRHQKCLEEYLEFPVAAFHSIVFFIGECTLKSSLPPNVMARGLSDYIKSHKKILLSDEQIDYAIGCLHALKHDSSLNHSTHMQSLKERHESTTVCPRCGEPLIERKGKEAGNCFLGCSTYPRCQYIKKIDYPCAPEDGISRHPPTQAQSPAEQYESEPTPECLRCGATLIKRKGRKTGDAFWGCSTYPRCRYVKKIS